MKEKVLIVDDTATNRVVLRRILTRVGYEILEASGGEEALNVAENADPDVVLLDIVMPEMDGYEVCAEFKKISRCANVPVIFLSGRSDTQSKVKGFELGAVDYVTKPFKAQEVIARVKSQLKIRSLTRSIEDANRELLVKQSQLDSDLRAAADIQRSLIPNAAPKIPNVQVAWQFLPCDQIGGDIFDAFRLDADHGAFFLVDVSGHGVPSAMVTVSVSQSLSNVNGGVLKEEIPEPPSYRLREPDEVLRLLDAEYPMDRFEKYFTMCYALLNVRTGVLQYSCAAHPMPVLVRRSGEIQLLEAGGSIVGLGGRVPFEKDTEQLEAGDRVFFYTDGIVEFVDGDGEYFGEERLHSILSSTRDKPLDQVCETVIHDVFRHGDGILAQDDITILGIEYEGS